MGFADFLSGCCEFGLAAFCDFATDHLGLEEPEEGSYMAQMMEKDGHCNVLQMFSDGDRLHSLLPGTPVFCRLAGGMAEHAGIAIGRKIVHLDGSGNIICTGPSTFLARKNGSNMAVNVYYAATAKDTPLGDSQIAELAKAQIGRHQHYSVWTDNCLGFTLGCITGDFDQHYNYRLGEIESAISKHFGTFSWEWRNWDFGK